MSSEPKDASPDRVPDDPSAVLSDRFFSDLANQRHSIWPHAISENLLGRLRESFAAKLSAFRLAQIGRSGESSVHTEIRNDSLLWLEENDLTSAEAEFFAFLESVRLRLNRELFLGLTDFEAHYSLYQTGHFYARHVDRFQSDSGRIISMVFYLNTDWCEADGGHLRLYAEPAIDVRPDGGTIVTFVSDEIEHEVLPTNRDRMSIAVWFRRSQKF